MAARHIDPLDRTPAASAMPPTARPGGRASRDARASNVPPDAPPLVDDVPDVSIDAEMGEAAGIGGVIGAALGSAGGPVGAALGAAGGMVVGAAAELAVHAGSRLRRHGQRQPRAKP